jgi:hypothetical protein
MRRQLVWASLFVLATCSVARGETIFLKDGEEVIGQIIERTTGAIVVKEFRTGVLRTIRRSEIDLILDTPAPIAQQKVVPTAVPVPVPAKAEEPKKGEPKKGETKTAEGTKKTEGEPKKGETKTAEGEKKTEGETKTAEGEKKTEGETKTAEGEKKTEGAPAEAEKKADVPPELRQVFDDAMVDMDTDDPDKRGEAKRRLEKEGEVIIPVLVEGLNHKRTEARAAVADLLGEMNARNTVKQLVESFYAALPDSGRPAYYQTVYIRALGAALAKLTGETYITTEAKNELVQNACKQYIDWYNANYDRLPKQVGEPDIKATDPDYVKKLKEARQLKLAKRDWPTPVSPAVIATGDEKSAKLPPEAPTETKTDIEFGKSIPKVDRSSMGGEVRQADKDFGKSFFRGKEQQP